MNRSKSQYFVYKILEHFKIRCFFSGVSGGDTFKFKKPDPRHLTETIKQSGIEKFSCTFVGDSKNDALCAKESSSKLILMSYGYCKENIYNFNADLVTDNLLNIPKFLKI